MDDDTVPEHGELALHGAGEQLRYARERAGMTLDQVSAETRIPRRHLEMIEAGDFEGLPARTYATGFARTYAKVVGIDPRPIVEEVRAELAMGDRNDRGRAATFEPGDPARVPSRGLALFSLFALALLLIGGFMFYNAFLAPGAGPGSLLEQERLAKAASAAKRPVGPAATAQAAVGPVVFTALEPAVWVKFYDASGTQLLQKELAKGETYTVPQDVQGPKLWTGRPDALAITIGGKPVPKLAEREGIMKDVPVDGAALIARGQSTPAPAGTASPPAAAAAR
jgi:cytoskeleton protein RodZ